ncbi:Lrp/AsnC ligand binding domain-containing protein [Halobacteria archaeon AArc-m2/3/4]|uniref:Lrp/AsnC ligand binding domain-containing protein n=1 Tax=Natronoglomus mannanivorans TaxID=2979990 RepID=A0ABT2QCG9_9EURY|nr:Lrp/AsnC ligand binding domain-containing protein [Halobacteria archaeon AArc-m2/3/4]
MVHAFIMVKTAAGQSEGLLSAIRDIERVGDAHIVAGNYDIIAEVDAGEVYEVFQAVSNDIQGLDGVMDTKTYIGLN